MINQIPFPTDQHAKLLLPGPVGQLEVITSFPKIPRTPEIVAVICHPHPLFGGTMHNKVVYTLARCFSNMNLPTVRFNFRGVGISEGKYDAGNGECDDLVAILTWLKMGVFNQVRLKTRRCARCCPCAPHKNMAQL